MAVVAEGGEEVVVEGWGGDVGGGLGEAEGGTALGALVLQTMRRKR